ncbi:MAG: hypothetical protein AUI10_05970 [Actinobacteria bacterium 13_2_20CM_2_72_6]|nr:MAG: hypothetical protein AUI10_05970 [Actinobacteria bacterium 13_2_20CM_2_72_6]
MTQSHDPSAPFRHALIDVHSNYRGQRLAHEPPDELVSEQVTLRVWRPHVTRSLFFLFIVLIIGTIGTIVGIIGAFAGAADRLNGDSAGAGNFFTGIYYLLLFIQLLVIAGWIVAICMPIKEPIAEYGLLVEGRAPAAAVSYAWIVNTIRARQAPFRTDFVKVKGNAVLTLANGRDEGMAVVRPVGNDLFLGWSMWRSRSTLVLIGHLFRDMFNSIGTGRTLSMEIKTSATRSLRELIHSVTREGVQAAILQPPIPEDAARAQLDQLRDVAEPQTGYVAGHPTGAQPAHYQQPQAQTGQVRPPYQQQPPG